MRRRALALFAGILVLGLMPGPALAASVVDQSNEGQNLKGDGGHDLAQTVTVGQTGRLTGVDLLLYSANGWTDAVSIQTIERVSRKPTGSKLASATISVFGDNWYHIEFPTPVSLIAGGRFAIVLSQGGNCSWKYSSGTYSRGEALEYGSAWTNLQGDANLDFAFRTYMDSAPIPTPAPTQKPVPPATAKPDLTASPAATDLASPTASITTASTTASPSTQPSPQSGGSGDSGGPPIVLIIVGIVALAAVLGGGIGLGFVLARRPRQIS
jgi:hypothetical protein